MPRRKRREKAQEFEIKAIEQTMQALHRACDDLVFNLAPSRLHYETLYELKGQMRRTANVLNDRDPEYVEPHRGHMARG